jgi:hypothetical protein
LGLEAQRKVIEDFAVSRGAEVLARFTEVESGRKADRPELLKALHLAKVTGATLVIAKLGPALAGTRPFCWPCATAGCASWQCDMPEANDLTVGIMALVAQAEREAISRRTKEALAVGQSARGEAWGTQRRSKPAAGWEGWRARSGRLCQPMPRPSRKTSRRCSRISRRVDTHRYEQLRRS